jgi:hypothetical protein
VKTAIIVTLAALLLAAPAVAHADQCQWIDDPAIATRAVRELTSHPEIIAFCEPCGDVAPGAPRTAASVTIQRVDDRAVELVVNGDSVDLAYLYVKTSARQYRNLAALAGCPTTGVSPSLQVEAATSAGVLIRADNRALVTRAPAAVTPTPDVPVAAVPTVVIVSSAPSIGIMLLLACGAPLALLGGLALWLATRRRPLHVPRASRLTPPSSGV